VHVVRDLVDILNFSGSVPRKLRSLSQPRDAAAAARFGHLLGEPRNHLRVLVLFEQLLPFEGVSGHETPPSAPLGYRPRNVGGCFARKAATAARWSSVVPAAACTSASMSSRWSKLVLAALSSSCRVSTYARVGPAAICCANAHASEASASPSTTRLTSPIESAVAASTGSPCSSIHPARPYPTSRGNVCAMPASGTSPIFVNAVAKRAF